MKTVHESITKNTLSGIIFIMIALSIWFLAPLVQIQHFSLQSPDKRIYLIALIFLLWVLKYLLFDPDEKALATDTPEEVKLLHERFHTVLNFLKKNYIYKLGKKISLVELPWYLMIGPQSGKTSLLANSDLHFVFSKQFDKENLNEIEPTETCDWWVSRNAIFVDLPSKFFSAKIANEHREIKINPAANLLWSAFIKVIKSFHTEHTCQGIILTLNLPEMFNLQKKQEKSLLVYNLKQRIADLRKFLGHLPIYLVVTKCDLLPGFENFFAECSSEELSQPWGVSLPVHPKESVIESFNERFNSLIKRINKQLIWRLHQEHDGASRTLIKDFPQQLEKLKESISSLLKTFIGPQIQIGGVYLTSAAQHTNPTAPTNPTPNTDLISKYPVLGDIPNVPTRSYFIKHFLLKAFSRNEESDFKKANKFNIPTALTLCLILSLLVLGVDFSFNLKQSYYLQKNIERFQILLQKNTEEANLHETLALLETLENATSYTIPFIHTKISYFSHYNKQKIKSIYHYALNNILVKQIKNQLENYLQMDSKNFEKTYAVLSAYLSLANLQKIDIESLAHILAGMYSMEEIQLKNKLIHHLANLESPKPTALSYQLINKTRQHLTTCEPLELAYIILKNHNKNNLISAIDLGTDLGKPRIFVSKNIENKIPNMFVAKYFPKIYNEEIPEAAFQALHGNSTLGKVSNRENAPNVEELTTQLREDYKEKYLDLWESLIANIHPYSPRDLQQINQMILVLTSSHSPLLKLLKTIKDNTDFAPINSVTSKTQTLNNLFTHLNHKDNLLYRIFVSLHHLQHYISTQLIDPSTGKSISSTINVNQPIRNPVTQVEQIAEESPEPIKTWLHTLARQSWEYIYDVSEPEIS